MIKILRILVLMLTVTGSVSFAFAGNGKPLLNATFQSTTLYYGIGPSGIDRSIELAVTVATPSGVYNGVWKMEGLHKGDTLPLISWTGDGAEPTPTIVLRNFDNSVNRSNCPKLPSSWDSCGSFTVDITVQSDDYGCPWLATSHTTAYDRRSGEPYSPPDTRNSICPTVPVDTFDISWDSNKLQHETTLKLAATGGTINNTLRTYLMQGGKHCDGSKFDQRGAYCRFVATGARLTVLGCDQSAVQTTAVSHPITDVALHDINVSVNTKNIGSGQFTSTCNFQYILEEL